MKRTRNTASQILERSAGKKNEKNFILCILIMALSGCSDSIRKEYQTVGDAQAKGAFTRGWLPPELPKGSTQIVEENNLDSNSGRGSFAFPPESTPTYLLMVGTGLNARITKSPLGIKVTVTNTTTLWKIHLDPNKGQGKYHVKTTE